jgi:1-aminocyclopropane-1-carboxylate deaminase/D-cysteine desulfhydrase-like pyridoxal-dependent ACC family enzyme
VSEELTAKIRTAFGSCSLGRWPTPLEPAPALAAESGADALWLKLESASSGRYGGSKVRGLEFLLAGAPPDAVFVTIGGTGSTHCLATAVHARALGRRSVLAQFPQPATAAGDALARAAARAADVVERPGTRAGFPVAVVRAWRSARHLGAPQWIPGGGAHPRAVLGHVLAGLELATQLPHRPDAVVAPFGSTGTAAGLVLAMRLLEWPTTVVAVRVAPAVVANRWRAAHLTRTTERLLGNIGVVVPRSAAPVPLMILNRLGRGYGYPTPAGEDAARLAARHGIALDPTYGAKAFAAVPELPGRGYRRIVFWHTFAPPPDPAEPGS